ncbi:MULTISPECIES: c-type cytochrome [unclassified Sphingomonas]|uniref:c-type cytochrome n=1 Tax=unclassified Sphingomonas TaxID=196159 RepID=UPI001F418F4B|nr:MULTISPECIES: c-type cytochrome [unclassified Sphingomonas]
MRPIVGIAMLLTGLAALPAPAAAAAGNAANGATIFKRCAVCHSVEPGKRAGMGPNLSGVIGRKAGTSDFAYSPAMKAAAVKWSPAALDTFLTRPAAMIKGSRMAFAGLPNQQDRADVIAYLATRK